MFENQPSTAQTQRSEGWLKKLQFWKRNTETQRADRASQQSGQSSEDILENEPSTSQGPSTTDQTQVVPTTAPEESHESHYTDKAEDVSSDDNSSSEAESGDSADDCAADGPSDGDSEKIDDLTLHMISRELGPSNLTALALVLGFSSVDVSVFKSDHPGNAVDQIFSMLVAWRQKQPAGVNQTEVVCTALESEQVGRSDLCRKLREKTQPDSSTGAGDRCETELKEHYKSTGSYVQMIPWIDDDKKHIMNVYTALQLVNDDIVQSKADKKGKLKSYEDMFLLETKEGEVINIAVVSGLTGRGKSTLFDKMTHDWAVGSSHAMKKYKLVLLLKMNTLTQLSDLIDATFDQLLAEDTKIQKSALKTFIQSNSSKVLILLDGFDEFVTTSLCESSCGSILKILNRKLYRGCSVLVTTRPSHYDRLVTKQLVQQPFTHVRVLGFDAKDIREYVNKFYCDDPDAEGLLQRLDTSNVLSTLAESPMLLLLMCLLWRDSFTLPETMSRLYSQAVEYIFRRKADVSQEKIQTFVFEIGKVALHGLLSPDKVLSFKESDFDANVLDMSLKAGILTRHRARKGLYTHHIVQFIHKTFQEFCAGRYMQSLFETETKTFQKTLDVVVAKGPEKFEYLLRFCCGDHEACTNAILKAIQRSQKDVSVNSGVGQVVLHCHVEGQSKCLPPKEIIPSYVTDDIFINAVDSDCLNSFTYLLKQVVDQTKTRERGDNPNLAKVRKFRVSVCDLTRCSDWPYFMSAMTNLYGVELTLCSGTEQAMKHIAESLRVLPRVVELNLDYNILAGKTLFKHLEQLEHLQKLHLSDCSLEQGDIIHMYGALPNVVELDLSKNCFYILNGKEFSENIQQMRHLEKLNLSECSLERDALKHIAGEAMPNLVELDVSCNSNLGKSLLTLCFFPPKKHLRKLNLSKCSMDVFNVQCLGHSCPNLVELDLSNNSNLCRRCFLAYLKTLKSLSWYVTDNCHPSSYSGLYLSKDGTLLDRSLFACLKELQHLRKLNLKNCALEEEDIRHVKGAVAELVELNL